MSNLSRISQMNGLLFLDASNALADFFLKGFSDPIYVETYVKMHDFNILLVTLLVNQSANTSLLLPSTIWKLLNDRPFMPLHHMFFRLSLNDIHIDIVMYFKPAYCKEV